MTDIDRQQFVAMKVAEAWETYFEMLSDNPDDDILPVPWRVYARATEKIALRLWGRMQRREKKRARRTRSLETLLDEPASSLDHVRDLINRDLLRHMLQMLTDHQASIVRLAMEHNLPHDQIAPLLGVTTSEVANALHRARTALKSGIFPD